MRNAAPCALALAALVSLAACDVVGDSPQPNFYVLDSVPAESAPPAVEGAPLIVDDVVIPESLERPEIVRRLDRYRVAVSDVDRWAAPLAPMIRDVLIQDLAERLPPGQVAVSGRPGEVWPARTLVVTIHEFAGRPDGSVLLEASWAVLEGREEEAVLRERQAIEVAGSGRGAAAQAETMSRALGRLADRIVAGLAGAGS